MMNSHSGRLGLVAAVALVLTPAVPARSQEAQATGALAKNPAAVRQRFDTVLTRLDTGGELLLVLDVDGLLERVVDEVVQSVSLLAGANPQAQPAMARLQKLPAFLKASGFYAVRGLGTSAVPRADGLAAIKGFISREEAAAGAPLWRGLVGLDQRRQACLDFLPADTVIARAGTGDLKELWKLARSGVRELASPEGAAEFEKGLARLTPALGIELEKLIASLGDEGVVGIQLSREVNVNLPGPKGPITIPAPSLLIALAVQDDTLGKTLEQKLAATAQPNMPPPLTRTQVGDASLVTLNLPLPSPIPIQLSFTTYKGYFLIASTGQVLTQAVKAFQGKNGLTATPGFKQAFAGLPMVNNGLTYVDRRAGALILDLQKRILASTGAPGEQAFGQAFQKIFGARQPYSCAMVILNLKNGVQVQGVSSSGGSEIVASAAVAPVGLLAAIAIPSFVKAREQAMRNACVNNLRIIDSAKEQWAMTHRKSAGDAVDVAGVVEYIKGGQLPKCPKGGTYTVNVIGKNPECSIPGHALNW